MGVLLYHLPRIGDFFLGRTIIPAMELIKKKKCSSMESMENKEISFCSLEENSTQFPTTTSFAVGISECGERSRCNG